MYITEKGEVNIAVTVEQLEEEKIENEDITKLIELVFQNRTKTENRRSLINIDNDHAEDEENKLEGMNVNVSIGEQFDTFQ